MIEPVLISGPDVWMESEATRQLAAVAQLEGCVHAAGMPDLHPGRGFPIGAVVATREVVHLAKQLQPAPRSQGLS